MNTRDHNGGNTLTHQDILTTDSFLVMSQHSPYVNDLTQYSKQFHFTVKTHNYSLGKWNRDYLIADDHVIYYPAKEDKEYSQANYETYVFDNQNLYCGILRAHYFLTQYKTVKDEEEFNIAFSNAFNIEKTKPLKHSPLEGGNFFYAYNKKGHAYYIIGEAVVSETMMYHEISHDAAIQVISDDLSVDANHIIVLPQWTYHLDMQMAYLGKGQFIIHSFDQRQFNFTNEIMINRSLANTFNFLNKRLETNIIDKAVYQLVEHDFEVSKVFGCLFYMRCLFDQHRFMNGKELGYLQKDFICLAKSGPNAEGRIALLMNGIAGEHDNQRYFITTNCENQAFKIQFESALAQLNVKVYYVNAPEDFYTNGTFKVPETYFTPEKNGYAHNPDDAEFLEHCERIAKATNLSEFIALEGGGLRCQTTHFSFFAHSPPDNISNKLVLNSKSSYNLT